MLALREEVRARYEEAKAADANLAEQEARYLRIAEGGSGEETAEEEPAGGRACRGSSPRRRRRRNRRRRSLPKKQPKNRQRRACRGEPAEEAPAEDSATAQNRETRFTESVRLRSEPSTEAEYLGTAYQGEHVTQIESYEDGWSKINYNGTECYCMTQYLE